MSNHIYRGFGELIFVKLAQKCDFNYLHVPNLDFIGSVYA